jgi:hypothetical protein
MEMFRRLLLQRLHRAERLSESFIQNLLSWAHPGFSVFAGSPVEAGNLELLESQARYITRPSLAMDALQKLEDGRLALETRPDPRTGGLSVDFWDPMRGVLGGSSLQAGRLGYDDFEIDPARLLAFSISQCETSCFGL